MCVYSRNQSAFKAHAPYYIFNCGLSGFHHIFPHYLTNAIIFGEKSVWFSPYCFHIISQKSVWFSPYFFTLSHKCHDLQKKVSGFHHIFSHYLINAIIFGKSVWFSPYFSTWSYKCHNLLKKSVWFSPYFFTLSHKCHFLRKKCLVFTIFFHMILQMPYSFEKSVWFSPYFFTLSYKCHGLRGKKLLSWKCVVFLVHILALMSLFYLKIRLMHKYMLTLLYSHCSLLHVSASRGHPRRVWYTFRENGRQNKFITLPGGDPLEG
jgi:hypothetical protein